MREEFTSLAKDLSEKHKLLRVKVTKSWKPQQIMHGIQRQKAHGSD
jgi:hypothetical protein